MNKKAMSLGVVLVALVGSLLAAFIPTASATRAPHSCTYAENATCAYSTYTAGPSFKVGSALGDGVIVTGNNFGDLTLDDHGTTVIAPKGAALTIASDGTLIVATTKGGTGTGAVTVIGGGKIKSIYLHPTLGITFGPNHSLATVQKYVTFDSGKTPEKVSAKIYNRPHGQLLTTLKTPTATPVVHIKSGILEYTKASKAYIKKHKVKIVQLQAKFTTTTGKVYVLPMYFPITTLNATVFPKTTK